MRAQHFLPALVFIQLLAWAPALAQTPVASTKQVVKPAKIPASDQFKTPAAAATHCPKDTVVWSSFSSSRVYHAAASKYYGKTKHGAYVCEKDALAFGYHASKR
jgi:hypothetical protein